MTQQRCTVCHKKRRKVDSSDRRHPGTPGRGGQRIVWRGQHVMSRWNGGCPWCTLAARENLLRVFAARCRFAEAQFDRVIDRLGEVFVNFVDAPPRTCAGHRSAAERLWRAGWRGDTSAEHAHFLLRRGRPRPGPTPARTPAPRSILRLLCRGRDTRAPLDPDEVGEGVLLVSPRDRYTDELVFFVAGITRRRCWVVRQSTAERLMPTREHHSKRYVDQVTMLEDHVLRRWWGRWTTLARHELVLRERGASPGPQVKPVLEEVRRQLRVQLLGLLAARPR